MKQYDILFPGQGAQYPGMGSDLYEHSQSVRDLFKIANDSAAFDVREVIFNGNEEDLKATDRTQIAITLINLSVATILKERHVPLRSFAGFSLGEYAALVEAGVISREDVFKIVCERGNLMEAVSRKFDSAAGKSGMAAVIGLSFEEVCNTIERSNISNLYPAIHNSPIQTVIAGTAEALQAAEEAFKEADAMRYIILRVSGPFHTPLMQEASEAFAEFLEGIKFNNPVKPVYSNCTAKPITDKKDAKLFCAKQLVSTVRWTDEQMAVAQSGTVGVLECGPGKVLAGLWKNVARSFPDTVTVKCSSVCTLEEIENLISNL